MGEALVQNHRFYFPVTLAKTALPSLRPFPGNPDFFDPNEEARLTLSTARWSNVIARSPVEWMASDSSLMADVTTAGFLRLGPPRL
jgi:hypothetical protein